MQQLWFWKLLFAIEKDADDVDGEHQQQTHPKVRFAQSGGYPGREIREDIAWPQFIRSCGSSQNGGDRTHHLRRQEGEGDVEPSHGIQQNHSKPYVDGSMLDMENPSGLGTETLTNTLKTIQHPKPQPERPSEDGSSNWPTRPRNIGADVGGGP